MTDEERYNAALKFAKSKHEGQFRAEGLPYITHPIAVAEIVKEKGGDIDYRITALFHDLLEDTNATEEEIEKLGGEKVLEAVKLLTKRDGYVMAEYVSEIRKNPIAFAVKGADRLHNLRCAVCKDTQFKLSYIHETIDWYLDFLPEMPGVVKDLAQTIDPSDSRAEGLSFLNKPVGYWKNGNKEAGDKKL